MQGDTDRLQNARVQLDETSWAHRKVRDILRRHPGITVDELLLELDAEVAMWGTVLRSIKQKADRDSAG